MHIRTQSALAIAALALGAFGLVIAPAAMRTLDNLQSCLIDAPATYTAITETHSGSLGVHGMGLTADQCADAIRPYKSAPAIAAAWCEAE